MRAHLASTVLLVLVLATSLAGVPLVAAGGAAGTSAVASPETAVGSASQPAVDGPSQPAVADASQAAIADGASLPALDAPSQPALDVAQQADGTTQPAEGEYDHVDEDDDPTTSGTLGYVEGYRYDDELAVDDRDDGTVPADELEAVVARSMARVELIRGLPFEEAVPVDVISREEFQGADDFVQNASPEASQFHNVRFRALFMVDRETDAVDAFEGLYGAAVLGYYDPETDEIVLVSDDSESLAVDEAILGHELLHALQDQQFDLSRYGMETRDGANAAQGLVEGDGVWVETAYDDRCGAEWECIAPAGELEEMPQVNQGLFLTIYHPYSDGPYYVDHLRERGGWAAVNDAYDEPPNSSSEVIRPGEVRDPVEIDVEDRSTDDWERLEPDAGPPHAAFGEAAMAAMFVYQAATTGADVGISQSALIPQSTPFQTFDYDHAVTDGWAGDELHAYAAADADLGDGDGSSGDADADPGAVETGYVWESEWTSAEEAAAFADGYREVLAANGADVADDVYELDGGYAGAYAVAQDGETVTIVGAPSVDDLDAIHDGATDAAEAGNHTGYGDDGDGDDGAADGTDEEAIPGFGPVAALGALVVVVGAIGKYRS